MLELRGVSVVTTGGRAILSDVDLEIERGALTVVLGPNGAGKTTLLRVMSGEIAPTRGTASLEGSNVRSYGPAALARKRCVLSQSRSVGFAFTAREVVALGRYAYGASDVEGSAKIDEALAVVGALDLRDRPYHLLSGGEAVKVDVARVIAQGSSIALLDEPTNHLDPRVQYDILMLFHELTKAGLTVVAALHDLNHAALFADQLLLMKDGSVVANGAPSEVLSQEMLSRVYDLPCSVARTGSGRPLVIPAYFSSEKGVLDAQCSHSPPEHDVLLVSS